MDACASMMKKTAPFLWNFTLSLLNAQTNQRWATADSRGVNEHVAQNREMDMGEIGGDDFVPMDMDTEQTGDGTRGDTQKESRASSRNMALLVIVHTIVSRAQQTLNYVYRRA